MPSLMLHIGAGAVGVDSLLETGAAIEVADTAVACFCFGALAVAGLGTLLDVGFSSRKV